MFIFIGPRGRNLTEETRLKTLGKKKQIFFSSCHTWFQCLYSEVLTHIHTHTQRMGFTQKTWNSVLRLENTQQQQRRQQETGRRESDTQTGEIFHLFFFFSYHLPLPHPFLSPHLVGLDSSLQVLDPFVSLCSWATRKALGSRCSSHLRLYSQW